LKRKHYLALRPFLHEKGARQKVIIYLLAAGYGVPDLVKMDVPALRSLALPIDLAVLLDDFLDERKKGPAFLYPNGNPIPHTAFYRLIRAACRKVLGRPMTVEQFRAWIRTTC
jgi:hypothetical protein